MNWQTQTGFCPQCGDVIAPRDFINGSHQCETEERLCQLCGEQIKDISKGAVVLPWGETCEECLKEIKK